MANEYSKATLDKMREQLAEARLQRALANNPSATTCQYKYGLGPRELVFMLFRQDFNCALCRATFEDRRWVIDHCHRTGQVRGLICCACNSWLGKNEGMVREAARYLEVRS
jgi:hypothetical protein